MDESWRMRPGIPNGGPNRRRRSMTEARAPASDLEGSAELEPEDFDDVFGGPPRSLLARKLSADFTNSEWFYREIFRQPEDEIPVNISGRRLPEFVVPEVGEFEGKGWNWTSKGKKGKGKKYMSRSKSTTSSILSYEEVMSEMSPYRWAVARDDEVEDVALSSFTSRLRPINIPSRWSSSSNSGKLKTKHKQEDLPAYGCSTNNNFIEDNDHCNDYMIRSFDYNYEHPQRVNSPETINLQESTGLKMPVMDCYSIQQHNSPSSAVSSLYHGPATCFNHNDNMSYRQREVEEDGDMTSSYVIEIDSQTTEVNNSEAIDINEAIAWAKEKFQGWSLDGGASHTGQECNLYRQMQERPSPMKFLLDQQRNGCVTEQLPMDKFIGNWEEQRACSQPQDEGGEADMDECVALWSAGNEANIRVLLSTLHQILWSSSGWSAIPMSNIAERALVKKAYQKARLCLHPDKLQQRGATTPQKYVAQKAFSILQDAWAAFILQDTFG